MDSQEVADAGAEKEAQCEACQDERTVDPAVLGQDVGRGADDGSTELEGSATAGCHSPPPVASRIAVFIWLTSGSALIAAYAAYARSTVAGEDRQVQLGEAFG